MSVSANNEEVVSLRKDVRLTAPELEILRNIGEASKQNQTHTLTSQQIDRVIAAARAQKKTRPH
jgi:hypothetical protein